MSYKLHQTAAVWLGPANKVTDDLAKFDNVVIMPRVEYEHPGTLAAIKAANPAVELWLYVSMADSVQDPAPHPSSTWENQWGKTVTDNKLWMPMAGGGPPRRRGRAPEIAYWKWPYYALVNCANPLFGDIWASLYWKHHQALESMAGCRLNIFVDNTFQTIHFINAYPDNVSRGAVMDADSDGLGDDTDALNTAWEQGAAHGLSILRHLAEDRLLIGNGDNRFVYQLNGRYIETFGGQSWKPYTWAERELARSWRWPVTNWINGDDTHLEYAFASAMTLKAGVAVQDYHNATPPWREHLGAKLGEMGSSRTIEDGVITQPFLYGTVTVDTVRREGLVVEDPPRDTDPPALP
jgi:hypothetical protein